MRGENFRIVFFLFYKLWRRGAIDKIFTITADKMIAKTGGVIV